MLRRFTVGFIGIAVLVSGCSPAPGSAGTPVAPTAPSGSASASLSGPVSSSVIEVRRTKVRGPGGATLAQSRVEFAGANHGYALLVSGQPVERSPSDPSRDRYKTMLYATEDGGRTWTERRHPQPVAENPQIYVGGPQLVLLSTGRDGWYISLDGGRSFRHDRRGEEYMPPEYELTWANPHRDQPYFLDCVKDCTVMRRGADGVPARLPNQPTIGAGRPNDLRVGPDGRIWVLGVDQRAPAVAVSADGGKTWHRRNLTLPADVPGYSITMFRTSRDGADLWIEAGPDYLGGGAAGRSLRVRKQLGLPYLWRLVGDEWRPQGTQGRPDSPEIRRHPASTAALGDGIALVTGKTGPWLVEEGWTPISMPIEIGFVQTLPDGSLMALPLTDARPVFLGTRKNRALTWIEVSVEPTG